MMKLLCILGLCLVALACDSPTEPQCPLYTIEFPDGTRFQSWQLIYMDGVVLIKTEMKDCPEE